MKCRQLLILAALLLTTMELFGQSYKVLWKQVETAQEKDLPKTAVCYLEQLEKKATRERAYGQLLKATLLHARLQSEVAPDSLQPAVNRLERQEQKATDVALQAVYDAVLSVIYKQNHQLTDDWERTSRNYAAKAMEHPEALAAVKADDYVPFVVKGKDSELYGHDLLSIVGHELEAWQWLSQYYERTGNRRAACLTALAQVQSAHPRGYQPLAQSDYIHTLDSLISVYGDLPEAGEIAIERYDHISSYTDATARQKYEWLQTALQRWAGWRRMGELNNRMTELTNPQFYAEVPQRVAEVDKAQTVELTSLRHISQLTMNVYRTSLEGDTSLDPNDLEDYRKIQPGMKVLTGMQRTLTFGKRPDYEVFSDSLVLGALPAGVYLVEFQSEPATRVVRQLYFVSGVRLLMQPQPDGMVRYVVVDATTGQPIAGARLLLTYSRGWNKPEERKTLTCNSQGEVLHNQKDRQPAAIYAMTATDKYCPRQNTYGRYSYYEPRYGSERTNVFTDRAIYRPGQTVYVTAIMWREVSATAQEAIADKEVTIQLRDANNKEVARQQVTTDRYGKCTTTFTLPTGQLNGRFTVRVASGSATIRVEEYKRPAFQVEFDEYKQSYQQGDTVRATGRAMSYAGVPVQGARVHYTVKRRMAWWWLSYSRYWQGGYSGLGSQDEVVGEGTATTGDDGVFTVDMPMVLPADALGRPSFYHFVAEADVTDVAGETHTGTLSLPLGTKATALTCDLPEQVRSDRMPTVTFSRRNAAGQEIDGIVRYRIDGGKWQKANANVQSSNELCSLIPSGVRMFNVQYKSGSHRLEAVCEEDSIDVKFTVFSLDDKRPAATTDDWFYVSDSQFPSDGTPVTLQVGSSDPALHIVYAIYAGDRLIESGTADRDAALVNRKFSYDASYGDGLLLTYAWIKNGICHSHQTTIRRPMPDRKLRLTWETFRDRLLPGQQEEWRLRIMAPPTAAKGKDDVPADATLMAVLYDKSLDQLVSHQWSFSPTSQLSMPSTSWQLPLWGSLTSYAQRNYRLVNVQSMDYSRFDDSVFPYYHAFVRFNRGGLMMAKAASTRAVDEVAMADVATASYGMAIGSNEAVAAQKTGALAAPEAKQEEAPEQGDVQLRENLQETAFCYPALETDSEGRVTLKFTLPESLTTWRFMGIAHTADMLSGSIEGEAVAKKDVMIQPNMPRFIRMGDEAQITARVINTSEHAVSGTAILRLTDPATETVLTEVSAACSVEAGKTTDVNFVLPKKDYPASLLVCRVMVTGDGFSDGEQHYLAVLPDREHVTKTIPFTQHEPGVKTIDLTTLFPQGSNQQKLTVEYTNNPAWLMVQSLPVVGQPWEHSAIEQAAAYYSNLLAKTLMAQSPQVKTTFEQWKREQGEAQTLQSQLEKNQELKDLLLTETPWVFAADRETEQRQQLAVFFDENAIAQRLTMAVDKLKKLQQGDGSFAWYPGMPGSTMVTVTVAEMLARLTVMAGQQTDTRELQTAALGYLDREMVKLVAEMKKQERKGVKPTFPSFTALRWLYVQALDGRKLSADVKAATDYLLRLLKKDIKNQTIYEKALTAIILSHNGEERLAAEYVKSLKEYTVYTEEMGRYYDAPRAGYSWYDYRIPTEVAAIEALQRVTPQDVQTVDEMRRWLLQEKRTQAWDTPISSVNAIWAFLAGQPQLLAQQEQTVLAIDGTPMDMPTSTAGLGYVKTTVSSPTGRELTATKTSTGTSWGAVYAQFMQKTTDVEQSSSGVKVKREVMASADRHPSAATQFKVGDRVKVRITIEAERDLDFVQVADRRAACMEPVEQLSGYRNGAYCSPKDCATHYFFYQMAKGKHVIETEYYIDRAGSYLTGTLSVQCAYAPEYRATAPAVELTVQKAN